MWWPKWGQDKYEDSFIDDAEEDTDTDEESLHGDSVAVHSVDGRPCEIPSDRVTVHLADMPSTPKRKRSGCSPPRKSPRKSEVCDVVKVRLVY